MNANLTIDETKMSSYIRTESPKLYAHWVDGYWVGGFIRDDIPGNLRDFCRRIKWQIHQNVYGDTETVGFDVKWNDKGWCRLVDSTTQVPCTKWHSTSNYHLALKELYSIIKK